MPALHNVLLVAAGGALGALARFGVSVQARRLLGDSFPFGTLLVNVVGCLLLGALLEAARGTDHISHDLQTFAAVGFLGAFTTFSTFGVETVELLQTGQAGLAATYVMSNVGIGLLAVVGGIHLARLISGV